MNKIIAVDTGGTFTDLAAYDVAAGTVTYAKSPTTYGDLCDGVFHCLDKARIPLPEVGLVKHGTTLVINALLQRRGARTALITNQGFRDLLEIGRGNRPVPFDLAYRRDPPLVPREMRFEVAGRMDANGHEIDPLDLNGLDHVADEIRAAGMEAVAISFLNAYCGPQHELAAAQFLHEKLPDVFISTGSELSREWYEFERLSTAVANAFVGPQVRTYIGGLRDRLRAGGAPANLALMGSNGGLLSAERAMARPVALVESGPVGGCIGAAALADGLGLDQAISFDMGGTTAKCALIDKGKFDVTPVYYVGGYDHGFPVRAACVDIVEVGAGGGSIAWLDDQQRLNVGPRSAGSEPGPACYGKGGMEPTVTDANLVLGRLAAEAFLGGEMVLDLAAAKRSVREKVGIPLGLEGAAGVRQAAGGILSIANLTMGNAVKKISLERGLDTRDFTLIAYGGAGPLHGVQVARELHIPRVIIPPEPGNFAAVGMLLADARMDESKTFLGELNDQALDEMNAWFAQAKIRVERNLRNETGAEEIRFERYAELRYRGQVHSVRTPLSGKINPAGMRQAFEQLYRDRYGHAQAAIQVEIVGFHGVGAASTGRPALEKLHRANQSGRGRQRTRSVQFDQANGMLTANVYERSHLQRGFAAHGPAVIEEYGSTTLVGPDDHFEIGKLGEIRITIGGENGRYGHG